MFILYSLAGPLTVTGHDSLSARSADSESWHLGFNHECGLCSSVPVRKDAYGRRRTTDAELIWTIAQS